MENVISVLAILALAAGVWFFIRRGQKNDDNSAGNGSGGTGGGGRTNPGTKPKLK